MNDRFYCSIGLTVLFLFIVDSQTFAQTKDDGDRFFETKIRPVLIKECYSCHSEKGEEIEGGLALDTKEGMLKGGERGAAVVPGKVRKSLLITAMKHADDDFRMPPEKKLSAEVIADFEKWVLMGAPDPRVSKATVMKKKYTVTLEEGKKHWAYQPPQKPGLPRVDDEDWVLTDIDRFVLDKLKSNGLKPNPDSNRTDLLRRISFDLVGLPPSASDVSEFEASQKGIESTIDRLINSPSFGEKWARHWLDLARYAESTGKTVNFYYPQAWRYRDYVIQAFNDDKPYDQFIKEQIAGDLLPAKDAKAKVEQTIATGFLALGPKTLNERNGLKYELDIVDEQIDVTTRAFLGITVACSRCHDHKFDPIPQKDYYAMAGIFRSTQTHYGTVRYINAQRPTSLIDLPDDANVEAGRDKLSQSERERIEGQIESTRESMREMKDRVQAFFASGRVSLLQAQLDGFDDNGNPKIQAMGVSDKTSRRFSRSRSRRFGDYTFDGSSRIEDSPVYLRGEPDEPTDDRVPRGGLQIISDIPIKIDRTSSGRLELANWIVDRKNPLTARVLANRVWSQIFGRGIVTTADDFGMSGQEPSHPELLDHLAIYLIENKWSVKKLIKYIMTSRVYRLSSRSNPQSMEKDPDNVYLWRVTPRRLDAEILRDSMLATSGLLETKPPVGSVVAKSGEGPVNRFGRSSALSAVNSNRNYYRSIYLPIIRDNLPEVLSLFDAADPSLITATRSQTNVPSQGLFLLNSQFVMNAADATARSLLKTEGTENRINDGFKKIYGRLPTTEEAQLSNQFLTTYRSRLREKRTSDSMLQRELWSAFCQGLYASAEFQFRK